MSCVITLRDKGLRLTPQRRMILDIIHDKTEHFTAEEIISYVQSQMPGVNKSTIYRTLELLEQAGCVFKSESGDGFIYHHAEEGHHHHLVCRECGATIDLEDSLLAPMKSALLQEHNFVADLKHLAIFGRCIKCGG